MLNEVLGGGGLNNILNEVFGIHGNIGDYAWGRGLEDLMNQLFVNHRAQGAPPAPSAAIKALPKISVESKHKGTALLILYSIFMLLYSLHLPLLLQLHSLLFTFNSYHGSCAHLLHRRQVGMCYLQRRI
jgi:hypothetical protein